MVVEEVEIAITGPTEEPNPVTSQFCLVLVYYYFFAFEVTQIFIYFPVVSIMYI